MTQRSVRVGIVDSGLSTALQARVAQAAAFVMNGERCLQQAATPDVLGHGSIVAESVVLHVPEGVELLNAQVFQQRLATTAIQVAAALDWLVEQGAQVINLSLGLRSDRAVLAEACARAVAAGVVVCAASPARGDPVYPSAYPGVLRVTGDARCAPHEWSWLATAQADYGAHVAAPGGQDAGAGASLGCAHLAGHIAGLLLRSDLPLDDFSTAQGFAPLHQILQAGAHYRGPERRQA